MKIVQKGYCLDLDKIHDGVFYSGTYTVAENINKAKVNILSEIKYDDYKDIFGKDITYLNVPVKRDKQHDKVEFEGKVVSRWEVLHLLKKREKEASFQVILDDPKIKFCYIIKGGSYYKPDNCGYTDRITSAGVYTKEEAVSSAKSCDELRIKPIDIEEHNKKINEAIDDLKTRLI